MKKLESPLEVTGEIRGKVTVEKRSLSNGYAESQNGGKSAVEKNPGSREPHSENSNGA